MPESRYFQYKAFLETSNAGASPKLYNITFNGHTAAGYEDVAISNAWLEMNGENYYMQGSGYHWSKYFAGLGHSVYNYKVYANDSYGIMNVSVQQSFTVPSYSITFNVTSGEDGSALDNVSIACNYGEFNQNGDTANMYGSYDFLIGSWQCDFTLNAYYNKTVSFEANVPKNISITLSKKQDLTNEEHKWLEELYNCVINGDCNAYSMWENTNKTVGKIWKQFLPTDKSVVEHENLISDELSPGSNISLEYWLDMPAKEGYANGELLPIRIFYWFIDENDKCYNQDKQSDSNTAADPYCIPIMAEYLGPNNGTISFKVNLRPNLPDGTYEVVRSIDIDPPVNGKQVWINYGRESIGSITVVNAEKADATPVAQTVETVIAEALNPPKQELGLNKITGRFIDTIQGGSVPVLIGLAMICVTISVLGVTYIRHKK